MSFSKPWLKGARRLIFISDMGDALSEGQYRDAGNYATAKDKRKAVRGGVHEGGIPFEYLKAEIIDNVTSEKGRRHIWLWLTKRPHRMAQFAAWLREEHGIEWPDNLWAGTSITTAATLGRVRELAKVGAAVMFLSVEPLWEMVSFKKVLSEFPSIRWLLLGGESDQGEAKAHEVKLEWARDILRECREAEVAFFLKQLGSNVTENGVVLDFGKGHAGEWEKWPEDLRVREVPREAYVAPSLSMVSE